VAQDTGQTATTATGTAGKMRPTSKTRRWAAGRGAVVLQEGGDGRGSTNTPPGVLGCWMRGFGLRLGDLAGNSLQPRAKWIWHLMRVVGEMGGGEDNQTVAWPRSPQQAGPQAFVFSCQFSCPSGFPMDCPPSFAARSRSRCPSEATPHGIRTPSVL